MTSDYPSVLRESLEDPDAFWRRAASGVSWYREPDCVLDRSAEPFYRWFSGGRINTCFNALDRHVEAGRGRQTALTWVSAMVDRTEHWSYLRLRDETAAFAGYLAALGVRPGDRVVIYMPMVPQTVIGMLACARIGAVHSVVFGGFASHELAARIDDARPKVILSASCGLEPGRTIAYKPLLDAALELASHRPDHVVVLQRPELEAELGAGELDWADAASAAPHGCVPVDATDPLYILYTSGTTGQPKGIVRDNGGHAVALNWSMQAIYGVDSGDVFWAASDVGWVVGHSYIVYAPLLAGCTTILYEGKPIGTPDAGAFWRIIAEHDVRVMFTAPTALRAIRRVDPEGAFITDIPMPKLDAVFLAGERSDPETLNWAIERLGVPVIDHWWQTETGWPITGIPRGLGMFDIRAGAAGKAMPGWDVRALDENGREAAPGTVANVCCRLPLPPGTLPTLWNADDRFRESYLDPNPGYYTTGDAGLIDDDGYVHVLTRTDDVINVAGHRLSTGVIEEVIATHPDVAECAVTGIRDDIKGQVPLGFVCLKSGIERDEAELVAEVCARVRERVGPVAAFKRALVVERLPKTRSGKVLRGTLRRMADGERFAFPATIDDPAILEEIGAALSAAGFEIGEHR